jgi:hypothetical protein
MLVSSHSFCWTDPLATERVRNAIDQRCHGQWQAALRHCVPQLLDLTLAVADELDAGYERQVRQIIHEHCSSDEGGDGTHADHEDAMLDQQIAIVIDLLEAERHKHRADREHQLPPLMFG